MSNIKLESSDGEIFEVDVEIAKASSTIREMLSLEKDTNEEEVVHLPKVSSAILRKVIQWATHHKDDPPPPEDDDENEEIREIDISSWDADFLKVDQPTLFELILAANYLDIKGLLDVTCQTLASMIKGKTPEQIRQLFNIENDLPPSEEEQARKETNDVKNEYMVLRKNQCL